MSGNKFYYNSRDIDGDGKADQVQSQGPDGTNVVTHVDEYGEVILDEYDTDADGTFDTTVRDTGVNTAEMQSDLDNDGDVDEVGYFNTVTGHTYQQDHIENGQVTETLLDTDNDAVTDYQFNDTTGNGKFDTVSVDTDADGVTNALFEDVDGDGQFDVVHVDGDNVDGILETSMTTAEYGDGALGSVSEYESMIVHPAEDFDSVTTSTDAFDL